MTEAARLAAQGCASGTVVGADEQTAGQGRLGRKWISAKHAGLYFTVVLRLNLTQDSLPVVTLALGLAVSEAITAVACVVCDLRWPNDVLIGGRKLAGILVQLEHGAILAGIGININSDQLPDDLYATSLTLSEPQRQDLLHAILNATDRYTALLEREGTKPILDLFTHASTYVSGKRIVVDQGVHGTTAGLDPSGFLILQSDDGKRSLILAGGVRPES
jgi:BirA family transcriptional regulator, biotin operon repressor / biotin---[acetyl-CoA-carboxylase] ligase